MDLPYYEVLIFYTDGVNLPHWGGICADISQEAANVLCRQLGFMASGIPQSGYINYNYYRAAL